MEAVADLMVEAVAAARNRSLAVVHQGRVAAVHNYSS